MLPQLDPAARSAVWGVLGCGKSTLTRKLAEMWSSSRAVVIIDPNGSGTARGLPKGWNPIPGLTYLSPVTPTECVMALQSCFAMSTPAAPVTVICDEAPHYLKAPSPATLRCFNQGRHRGLGIVLVGQRPSGVNPDVRANATTTIWMQITDQYDLNIVSAASRDLSAGVRQLKVGEWRQWPPV